jgi:hypothetical protein
MRTGRVVLLLSALSAQCCHGELTELRAAGHAHGATGGGALAELRAARQRPCEALPARSKGGDDTANAGRKLGVAKAAKSTARVNERLVSEACAPPVTRTLVSDAPAAVTVEEGAEGAAAGARPYAPPATLPPADTLLSAPADIDLDSELGDEAPAWDEPSQGGKGLSGKAAEVASAAADRARQAAQRGMLALSAAWSTCVEQTKQTSMDMQSRVRRLPEVAARLVPPSPARRGLQTLVSESASLWAGALFKILMLQVMVVLKTVVSQGHVIARSFIQAASLEPTALVPDSPILQRQRSRAKALAAQAQAQEARMRMQELQAQMHQTAEKLRAAEIASYTFSQGEQRGDGGQWRSNGDAAGSVSGSSSWRGKISEQHVSFLGSTSEGALIRAPATPRHQERRSPSPSHLLMSASRRTPLPASPLPPPTPAVNNAHCRKSLGDFGSL